MKTNDIGIFLIIILGGCIGLTLFICLGNLLLNLLKIPDSPERTKPVTKETSEKASEESILEMIAANRELLIAPIHVPSIYCQHKRQELLS